MFNWLKNLFKKKTEQVVVREVPVEVQSLQKFGKQLSVKVVDYPHTKYAAYWEIERGRKDHKHTAEVRFYGRKGEGLLSKSNFVNSSKDAVTDSIDSLVKSKMESFKV